MLVIDQLEKKLQEHFALKQCMDADILPIQEQIVELSPSTTVRGQIARVGAIKAAIGSGNYPYACELVNRYKTQDGIRGNKTREDELNDLLSKNP